MSIEEELKYKSVHEHTIEILQDIVDSGYGGWSLITDKLAGFKNQFNPLESPGCMLGYSDVKDKCLFTTDFGFTDKPGLVLYPKDFLGSVSKFRIYIPAGTTQFKLEMYLGSFTTPDKMTYGGVIKMDVPPTRTQPLTTSEYEKIQAESSITKDFYKVLSGKEVYFMHNGSGKVTIGGVFKETVDYKIDKGRWLFINVLNMSDKIADSKIYEAQLMATYNVNTNTFRELYNSIVYDSAGNPVSSADQLVTQDPDLILVDPTGIKVTPSSHSVPVYIPSGVSGGTIRDPNAPEPPPPPEYLFTVESIPEGAKLPPVYVFPREGIMMTQISNSKVIYKVASAGHRTEVGMVDNYTFTCLDFVAEASVTTIETQTETT